MQKELSPLVIYQIFKGKYLAKYEFSNGETLTYDAQCISLYSLLGYKLFHCYYTAVACKNSHGVSMAYKFSMAYFSRTPITICNQHHYYIAIMQEKMVIRVQKPGQVIISNGPKFLTGPNLNKLQTTC